MDLETTARMVYLAEQDQAGHTPYFIKRCVYAVAKKFGGDRKALDKAFAICVAQAQKRGDLKKGSMAPTKSGTKDSVAKKQQPSEYGFTLDKYEKLLAKARQKKEDRAVSLVGVYASLQEEMQIEQHVDEGGVKTALRRTVDELTALNQAIEEKSLVSIPGILANLLAATLGPQGIVGKLGARALLSAVDINPASFGHDLKIMVQTFKNIMADKVNWTRMKGSVKRALGQLKMIPHGQLSQERVISILGDFFLVLGQFLDVLVRGIPEKRAKNAALVLRYDMQEISDGLTLLAGTAEE